MQKEGTNRLETNEKWKNVGFPSVSSFPLLGPVKRTCHMSSGQNIPSHSSVSLSKFNLQQSRSFAEEKCVPRKTKLVEIPLQCVTKKRPPAPCVIPSQKNWQVPEFSMCLPCCDKVEKPLGCHVLETRVNVCPRKTYRIPAYSECLKRYGDHQEKKECCYTKKVCHTRAMAERELRPLVLIRNRQAHALGFDAPTTVEPWGS